MKVLGVIPARGGSKGIPRKNLSLVNGKPLIEYTIEQAKASELLEDVILSTDDSEIAEVGISLDINVPFIRPSELAEDDTSTIDVLFHLCQFLAKQGRAFDAICLLQPTSPQRPPDLIDKCIERFMISNSDSLVTLSEVSHGYNPSWQYVEVGNGRFELVTGGVEPIPRRQLLKSTYIRDGRIYLSKVSTILNCHSMFGSSLTGYVVEPGVNVDTPEDLEELKKQLSRDF